MLRLNSSHHYKHCRIGVIAKPVYIVFKYHVCTLHAIYGRQYIFHTYMYIIILQHLIDTTIIQASANYMYPYKLHADVT